jgi:hypothetical protein
MTSTFQTADDRLTVYSCDFFKMKPDLVGKVDAVFDRGAFEAINAADRAAYADLVFRLLAPKFRYVLNGYEYPEGEFRGPPMHVPREEVFKFFQRETPEGKDFWSKGNWSTDTWTTVLSSGVCTIKLFVAVICGFL